MTGYVPPTPWWRPWVTHPRMVLKWTMTGAAVAGAAWLDPPWWPLLVGVGFLLWFPLEYALHRFIFHYLVDHPQLSFASQQHWTHHLDPEDPDKLFADPYRLVGYSIPLYLIYAGLTQDWGQGLALLAGSYAGLVYYEYMHLLTHTPGVKPRLPWTKALKKWHLLHHYKHEDHWYGVTNRTLDRILGTAARPEDVETSETVRTLGVPPAVEQWLAEQGE